MPSCLLSLSFNDPLCQTPNSHENSALEQPSPLSKTSYIILIMKIIFSIIMLMILSLSFPFVCKSPLLSPHVFAFAPLFPFEHLNMYFVLEYQ
jgi:hypothetical protein